MARIHFIANIHGTTVTGSKAVETIDEMNSLLDGLKADPAITQVEVQFAQKSVTVK